MTPTELRALLAEASPRPWHGTKDVSDANDDLLAKHRWQDAMAIVALMNRADLLIELWGAAKAWHVVGDVEEVPGSYRRLIAAITALEAT